MFSPQELLKMDLFKCSPFASRKGHNITRSIEWMEPIAGKGATNGQTQRETDKERQALHDHP